MGKAKACAIYSHNFAALFATLTAIVIGTNSPVAAAPVTSADKQFDAIMLKQVSFIYGEHTIYLTHDCLKDVAEKTGMISIARAPDWHVVTFNPLKKIFIENSKQTFSGPIQGTVNLFGENNMHDKELVPALKTKFMNHLSQCYVTPAAISREVQRLYSLHKAADSDLGRVDMVNVVDLPVSPEQKRIIAKIYDLPDKPGLTVEFMKTFADGTVEPHLRTTQIKMIKLPSSELHMSANYKRVKDYAQLLSNSESTNDGLLKMMIGDGKKQR